MPHASLSYVPVIADVLIGLLVLAFALLAFRDVARLRTGFSRAWAVGRITLAEAWNARIWAVPLLWFLICLILTFALVRSYGPGGEVRVDLTIFLRAQEILLLVYLGVLACLALPRERERRTLITTGSKPITRLELLLGKVMGLSAAALLMILVMMGATWGFMKVVDARIRHDAWALYHLQKKNYDKMVRHLPPQAGLLYLARHGVLRAQNNITGRLRIAGYINYAVNPPIRALKGGSAETLYFEFPSLPATLRAPPLFVFHFGVRSFGKRRGPARIHVTLVQRSNPMNTEEKSLTLNAQGSAVWQPKKRFAFFSYVNPMTGRIYNPGPVVVKVASMTAGDYLFIANGRKPQDASCLAWNMDRTRTPGHTNFVAPKPDPIITGFKSNGKQEVVGPSYRHPGIPPEVASFEFRHLKRRQIPINKNGDFTVHLLVGVDKQMNEALPAKAQLLAYDVDNPQGRQRQVLRIDDKHITVVKLPASLLDGSSLVINLSSMIPGHWLKITPASVAIVRPPSPFILNLAKSELVVLCEVTLLIVIGVTAGTCLGWPVALLTTMVCYILGNIVAFVGKLSRQGGFGLLNYVQENRLKGVWYYQIGSLISAVMVKMLNMLVHLLPDFTRFDPLYFIVRSVNMPWTVAATDVFWTLACVLPTLALGYLLLRKQELA